jgi:hypothetical protein
VKAILEFSLPDDAVEHSDAINGTDYKFILQDMDSTLRDYLKYGHEYKTVQDALEGIRKELHSALMERSLSLD